MQVREVMSKDVKMVAPSDPINKAAKLMEKCDCGSLPVGENDRLVGVVTDRDIVVRAVSKGKAPKECTVRDVMSSGIKYVFEDEPTEAAAESMSRLQVVSKGKAPKECTVRDVMSSGIKYVFEDEPTEA